MNESAIDRFKKTARSEVVATAVPVTETYKLTVTGTISYGSEDTELRDLLLSEGNERARLPEALQELEEEATDVKITLEKIS